MRARSRLPSTLSFALAAVMMLGTTRGMAAPKANDTVVADASRARYTEGLKLYQKKKYEQARASFLQSYALDKKPAALLMLGQCSLKLGRPMEALQYYEQFVDEGGEPTGKVRDLVEAGRRDARKLLAHVTVLAPDGAEVRVDDQPAGKTPLAQPLDMLPGKHTVRVTLGDDERVDKLDLPAGVSVEVKLVAKPRAAGPPPPPKLKSPTPIAPASPGSTDADSPSVFAPPETVWPVYAAGIVGLAGFTTAAIFAGLRANSQQAIEVSDATLVRQNLGRAQCAGPITGTPIEETCLTLQKNLDVTESQRKAAITGVVVGGVGIGVAVAWYFLAPKDRGSPDADADNVKLTPYVGPGGGGAALGGKF